MRHLTEYQDAALASRYEARVARAATFDEEFGMAVAKGYHKLLASKDEYEVARLHLETLGPLVDASFTGVRALTFHLAAPFDRRRDASGRPMKREYGAWVLKAFAVLARMKRLRGTFLDPFGRLAERRLERELLSIYEADLDRIEARWSSGARDAAIELAALPLSIRGFGHVKRAAAEAARARREAVIADLVEIGAAGQP